MEPILNLLVSSAYAQNVAPAPQGGGFSFIVMFLVLILFMYFAIWRPQAKRAKEQQQLLDSLAKGDEVVTTGGLVGKINKISGQYISLSVANNVDIMMQKSSVMTVLPKGTIKTLE